MGFLITLFLVLVNLFISITTNTRNTKSLTSISTWVFVGIIFVQGAVLEYGGILLLKYFSFSNFGSKVLRRVSSTNHVDQLGGGRGVVKYPLY